MINTNYTYNDMFNSAAREFVGRVELLEGSALLKIFEHDGALISFTVERIGDNAKFFGYGICQQITVKLRDKERALDIRKGQRLQAAYGIGNDYVYSCPVYIIDEVSRDENTNDLTIKAYDPIYTAGGCKIKDIEWPTDYYTLQAFASACASYLGMPVNFINIPKKLLNTPYWRSETNLTGEETIREVLDDLAEMFGAIYYFCNDWQLTFKCLNVSGSPVATITKSKYFSLSAKTAHTLTNIASITELNDNISTASRVPGETQYLRENVFLTLRDDAGELLENILSAVQGLTLQQFDCKHRGDFRLEIGDKIGLQTKTGDIIYSYILNDKITYHGGLEGQTTLEYISNDGETETNPTSLGDALKQTYARVDKANQTITLLANDMDEKIASLVLTTDEIKTSVKDTKEELESNITQTADSITLEIQRQEEATAQLRLDLEGISARGYVTFTDLAGTGTTTINGSNITTGTIDADRINLTGAISWGDLTQSCKNTIASYAGDSDLPDYIHDTYIDSTVIKSPTIQGGTLYAGNVWEGYCRMTSSGLNVVSDTGGNICGIGWHPGYYNLPYVVLGSGVDNVGTDQGLIKKYTHGIWIGDSDSIFASNEAVPTSGTGIFIDFVQGKIIKYINGATSELTTLDAGVTTIADDDTSHGIWSPTLSNETPVTGVTTRRGWYSTNGYITTIGFYIKMNVAANNNTIPIAITGCPFIPANMCSGGGTVKNVFTAAGLVFSGWNMNTAGTIQPALYNGSHSGGDITSTNAMYYPKAGGTIELSGTIVLNTQYGG